ncbi:MAG: response regulator transcription factor [Bacteroidetes bacterium]|nr:response regulator transcription factor [Bacteroidota bacterium]
MLIADDHQIIRDGIKLILSSINKTSFRVHEADSVDRAKELVKTQKIDVAFIDYRMGEHTGDELVEFLFKLYPTVKSIGISNYDETTYVAKMIKAGARGYILKNIGVDELQDCISKVIAGNYYYSKEVHNDFAVDNNRVKTEVVGVNPKELTPRELEILRLIALEYTNDEIAKFLGLAKRTVDNHRNNMIQRINARNTAGLIKYALQNGLVD